MEKARLSVVAESIASAFSRQPVDSRVSVYNIQVVAFFYESLSRSGSFDQASSKCENRNRRKGHANVFLIKKTC